ncbi:MAG: tyrosine/phenylalanine carboxypeptidase domain-containing protein [Ktedonobacteraceae bacterium]
MSPRSSSSHVGRSQTALHFGTLLKMVRNRHGIRQLEVLAHLSGWTQTAYSRLESGELAPPFDQLVALYTALHETGVVLTAQDRQEFLTLARVRIEVKKSHLDRKTDQEWEAVRVTLSQFDHQQPPPKKLASPSGHWLSPPKLMETRHLIGREDWLASVLASLEGPLPKKVVVLQGPTGIGKSSELHRIAQQLLLALSHPHVVLCVLPNLEQHSEPEHALDLVLGSLLIEIGPQDAAIQTASFSVRIGTVLGYLAKVSRPVLVCIDNAEHLLDAHGRFAPCWETFLKQFLRSHHHASLLLATREWPGWYEGERAFVAERMLPPLSKDEGVIVLQRLGLAEVAEEHLQRINEVAGGIPLCLEWVASLANQSLWSDSWDTIDDFAESNTQEEKLHYLLDDPVLFRGPIADRLTPLLERIIEQRLSAEAVDVLRVLSLANVPLGKSALQQLCPRPGLLKELNRVSLLAAHPQRVQVLPMVAAQIRSRLTDEERRQLEEQLIEAYKHWLNEGKSSDFEFGAITSELTNLYLKHHQLLDAAQLLIQYGWKSFNQGYAPRLAHCAAEILSSFDWHTTKECECGGLLLNNMLPQFLGKTIEDKKRAEDYQYIHDTILSGEITLRPSTEVTIEYGLMVYAMNELRFEDAQAILEACSNRLEVCSHISLDLRVSLLEKQSWLLGKWCEYNAERGDTQATREHRNQTITLCRQCIALLSTNQKCTSSHKKRLARAFNNLSYHLNRIGRYEEALQAIEQSITLKEQGYVEVDTLADAYGEKAEALAGLGRFQEALLFDEKALTEVQRLADTGYTFAQEEIWIYRVNRARLYLRLGRMNEAERILREAFSHIHPRRRMYQMFAKEALDEIEQWRRQTTNSQYQLDWKWVEQFRSLASYDSYWWLAAAGSFTEDEQRQWDAFYTLNADEATQNVLGTLLVQSQQREIATAIAEQREPHFSYPALDIADVRRRIADLFQLHSHVLQEEPNMIVRNLYQGAIEEEMDYLHLIEATYEGNDEQYWWYSQRLIPVPTQEEMKYSVSRLRRLLLQGLLHQNAETVKASHDVIQLLQERFHLSLDLSSTEAETQELRQEPPLAPPGTRKMITARAAKHFFEAALRESGYDGWQVIIDPNASGPRVEQGLRCLFLPENKMSVNQVKDYLLHEVAGHVSRCIAGEHSPLGLLGIHTKHSLETEEGLSTYYDRQAAALQGQVFDESGMWFGTLATGLASGVMTPPQTFYALFTFFESFIFLYRLLKRPDQTVETARTQAHKLALARCLRTYRGVPHLERAGICFTKDASYLRGLWLIERTLKQDKTILDRLAVGVVALEQLPELQALGIVSVPQPLKKLALDPALDSYILSFEVSQEHA